MADDTLSPDGTIRIRWEENEVRMSIWLQIPTVIRQRDERVMAVFPPGWTASVRQWPGPGRVTLDLMNYPRGDIRVQVTVDVERERCSVGDADRPLGELEALIQESLAAAIGPLVLRPDGSCPFCANATAIVPRSVVRVQCVICERVYPAPDPAPDPRQRGS